MNSKSPPKQFEKSILRDECLIRDGSSKSGDNNIFSPERHDSSTSEDNELFSGIDKQLSQPGNYEVAMDSETQSAYLIPKSKIISNDNNTTEPCTFDSDEIISRDDEDDGEADQHDAGEMRGNDNYNSELGRSEPGEIISRDDSEDDGEAEQQDDGEMRGNNYNSELEQSDSEEDVNQDEGDNDITDDDLTNEPLYNDAPISIKESMLAILLFSLKHSITGECLTDLLSLIALHCKTPNNCLKSMYYFNKYFRISNFKMQNQKVCLKCNSILDSNCTEACVKCKANIASNGALGYMVHIPIKQQLQVLFARHGFLGKLNYQFKREIQPNHISDIYDGEVYKRFTVQGVSNNIHHISLMWYTDGIPLFKSSSVSMWPLYLVINELPYRSRVLLDNMLVPSIWVGPRKPDMTVFFGNQYHNIKELFVGIEVFSPDFHSAQIPLKVKGLIIAGTCDLPAKASVLNMTQYNGRYGCHVCMQKGEMGESTYVYPYQDENVLRTNNQTVQFAAQANTSKEKAIMGVKGPCFLSKLVPDVIDGSAIDVMHTVYAGVSKKLLGLWCDTKYNTYPFSICKSKDVIDTRLGQIKPPSFIQRVPRSLSDIARWKASEFKNWLFYYSVPILHDILPPDYFDHHLELVQAIYSLNRPSINKEELDHIEVVLRHYVQRFENLYGKDFLTMVVHLLLHLPNSCRKLGPLWVTSCFPFESLNGKILKFVHGTQSSCQQIAYKIGYYIQVPELIRNLEPLTTLSSFCHKMTSHDQQLRVTEHIAPDVFVIGRFQVLNPIPPDIKLFLALKGPVGECKSFLRLKIKNKLFVALKYGRMIKHNNKCISYTYKGILRYGQVAYFFKHHNWCQCKVFEDSCKCNPEYFAVISRMIVETSCFQTKYDQTIRCNIAHIKKVSYFNVKNIDIIPIQHLRDIQLAFEVGEYTYLCDIVNFIELE